LTTGVVVSLVTAATAVAGSIGSVLLLAYNVGKLTGSTDARLKAGERDGASLHQSLGVLTGRFNRHIEDHPTVRQGR
jgi:hypothetical protein